MRKKINKSKFFICSLSLLECTSDYSAECESRSIVACYSNFRHHDETTFIRSTDNKKSEARNRWSAKNRKRSEDFEVSLLALTFAIFQVYPHLSLTKSHMITGWLMTPTTDPSLLYSRGFWVNRNISRNMLNCTSTKVSMSWSQKSRLGNYSGQRKEVKWVKRWNVFFHTTNVLTYTFCRKSHWMWWPS